MTAPAAEAAGAAAKTAAKTAAPKAAAKTAAKASASAKSKVVKAPRRSGGGTSRRAPDRSDQIKAGTSYAASKTSETPGGKPSVLGHTAKGAATGATVGAVAGSVVPGVGTAIGAGVGAAVGGAAGGVAGGRAKGNYRRANRSRGRQILVTEFVIAVVILALSPLTDKHKSDTPGQWLKRATGICALFVVLGLIGTVGERTSRAAAAFGGLVLLVLALTDRDILTVIAGKFGSPTPTGPAGPPLEGDISQGTGSGPGDRTSQPQQTDRISQPQQIAPRPRG